MVKESKKAAVKVKGRRESRATKVWRIFRWTERYELPDDIRFDRKSPLIYTKDFVGSGSDDESCGYFRQLMALRSKPNWLELRGAFSELKSIAGNTSKTYRGYLLNGNFKPASNKEIGRWLGVDEKIALQILTELEDVGLLERVPFPKFKTTEVRGKKQSTDKKQTSKKAPRRRRARTRQSERAREPLRAKDKDKIGLSASKVKAKNNPRPSALDKTKGQCKSKTATPTSPPTNPLITPTQSDVLGGHTEKTVSPPAPVHYADDPTHISHALSSVRRRCNQAAILAGREIYRALGSPWPDDSKDAAREVGCFAAQFEKAMSSGLPPAVLTDLWESLVKEGRRLSKVYSRNGGYKSAAKVWCKNIFPGKLVAALKERSPPTILSKSKVIN